MARKSPEEGNDRGCTVGVKRPIRVVGFCGAAGAGKTTLATMVAEQLGAGGTRLIAMAKPLKDIAYSMGWDGQKDEKGRRLLQLLGTECGRKCIGENVWVNLWRKAVLESFHSGALNILCDDVRFANEADAIKSDAGVLIRVTGRLAPLSMAAADHESERLVNLLDADWEVDNSGSLPELAEHARRIVEFVKQSRLVKPGPTRDI